MGNSQQWIDLKFLEFIFFDNLGYYILFIGHFVRGHSNADMLIYLFSIFVFCLFASCFLVFSFQGLDYEIFGFGRRNYLLMFEILG